MIYQHPVYPLIFSIILAAIVVKQCIIRKTLFKKRLSIAFVLVFVLALLAIFYQEIDKSPFWFEITNYALIGIDVLMAIFFFFAVDVSLAKEEFSDDIIRGIDEINYYLLLDKKLRIKSISKFLANEWQLDPLSVIGEKLNHVLEGKLKVISINGKSMSNEACFKVLSQIDKSKELKPLDIVYLREDNSKGEIHLNLKSFFILERYKGRILIGDLGLNKETVAMDTNYDEVADMRFETIVSKAQEGILFMNLKDQSIWCNDYMVAELGLMGNSLSIVDYNSLFEPNDYQAYQARLKEATPDNPDFEIVYRLKKDKRYVFVKENSRVLFDGLRPIEVCGTLRVSYSRDFMKSNSSVVDNLRDEQELLWRLEELAKKGEIFEVVTLYLENIPVINLEYGRAVGSMAIEEYVRTLKSVFVDSDDFFRTSGLEFCFIITDIRKMENFKRVISSKNIFTPELVYGSMKLKINAYMGISFSSDAIYSKDVYANSKTALVKAQEQEKSYMYYREVKL